jgi:3,4-dihydroxy 2-butanone 4-phosphate synthase/GTP cyclohydrolase II
MSPTIDIYREQPVPINTVEEILDDFRQGKMVLMMDDEDRENEGDLIIAADVVTPAHITFFARHACGLICLTITQKRAQQLKIPLMVDNNSSMHETNFTVSIEAAEGITTGISAADRAKTVRIAVAKNAMPDDLVQPGHIFPLIAQRGGVLTRAGHTEAGCDLARLSGYEPASVIVEVMNEDGTMAQRPELEAFAEKHGIKIGTIADLIQYRNLYDTTIERVDLRTVTTQHGDFELHTYKDNISDCVHYALAIGDVTEEEPCLVRVQVLNTLRDVLQTTRPGHSDTWSLNDSLAHVAEAGKGVVVLVGQDFHQQDELSQVVHFPEVPPIQRHTSEAGVYRVVGTGSQILRDVGVGKMRLLSSPTRFNAISGFHLEVVEFIEKT